jgi:hypothetical protein
MDSGLATCGRAPEGPPRDLDAAAQPLGRMSEAQSDQIRAQKLVGYAFG